MAHRRSTLARFILNNSLLLLAGTIAAAVWANLDLDSYDRMTHPLRFWVNDVGMVFFFALAAKEVFEATLPGGALASPRQAMAPLAAALGGLDAFVFTAGIGERSATMRARIAERLGWLGAGLDAAANEAGQFVISSERSRVLLHVIPTNEELMIARHTLALLSTANANSSIRRAS